MLNKFGLVASILALAFLILTLRVANGFPVKGYNPQTAAEGTFLIQDEGKAPTLCYSSDFAVKKLVETDSGVKIFIYVATEDGSRALVAFFANGTGIFFPMEGTGAVCSSSPMTPAKALAVKKLAENKESGIVVIPRWPEKKE